MLDYFNKIDKKSVSKELFLSFFECNLYIEREWNFGEESENFVVTPKDNVKIGDELSQLENNAQNVYFPFAKFVS